MKKFPLIAILVTLFIFIGGVLFFTREQKTQEPVNFGEVTSYEYFWGNGCPHCKNVDEFLSSWDKKDEVKIDKYEVWYNKANQQRLIERAKNCPTNDSQMGVPFMVTPDGQCLSGDTPIIEHFKSL